MAHTRVSAAVIDHALTAGIKVIAIGDSGQLSSVQAGGWLAAISQRVGAHELREVMRQREPRERRALADLHRGHPGPYLELKRRRGELRLFDGEQAGLEAEEALIERWMAARGRYGDEQAIMICRDNGRRERLNDIARARLREHGQLGDSVEIGEREWAAGERVVARRNDRGRDLDNGMRGTIESVNQREGLVIRLDAGGRRQLDVDYVRDHVEHAYALTAHGMQGATAEWAGVIGQTRDFSRNWSYTALSRAREPVDIFVVTEDTGVDAQRKDIAPEQGRPLDRDPLAEMKARMRERDDEDLALEQLKRAEPGVSPLRECIYELVEQLEDVNEGLRDPAIEDAKAISRLAETIAEVERVQQRERRAWRWRDSAARKTNARTREHHLASLREHRDRLLKRVPDAEAVLQQAAELRGRQVTLGREHRRLYGRAIEEELATRPPWLEDTLGREPGDSFLRERWQRTAREIAGHRIRHHITEPNVALDDRAGLALQRSVKDMRAALGIDRHGHEHGVGYE
jgi:ATP-dependent exoDNAse (exonuclease V) alpha subunit